MKTQEQSVKFVNEGAELIILIWNPQQDITTYELASCVPYFFGKSVHSKDELPKEIKRHFK